MVDRHLRANEALEMVHRPMHATDDGGGGQPMYPGSTAASQSRLLRQTKGNIRDHRRLYVRSYCIQLRAINFGVSGEYMSVLGCKLVYQLETESRIRSVSVIAEKDSDFRMSRLASQRPKTVGSGKSLLSERAEKHADKRCVSSVNPCGVMLT